MNKPKKQTVQFEADTINAIQEGLANFQTEVDKVMEPIRTIYNGVCLTVPTNIGNEDIHLCNQLRDFLEPRRTVTLMQIIGVLFLGLALLLDFLDVLWLAVPFIPFRMFINLGVSLVTGIVLTYWLGPIGLLFGWEVIADVILIFLGGMGFILQVVTLFPSVIIIIAAWWILFRRTGKFASKPITVGRCRVTQVR